MLEFLKFKKEKEMAKPSFLVLSRNPGQEIIINGNIVVRVMDYSRNGQVRLGIRAPRECIIDRREIWERKMEEYRRNQDAPVEK